MYYTHPQFYPVKLHHSSCRQTQLILIYIDFCLKKGINPRSVRQGLNQNYGTKTEFNVTFTSDECPKLLGSRRFDDTRSNHCLHSSVVRPVKYFGLKMLASDRLSPHFLESHIIETKVKKNPSFRTCNRLIKLVKLKCTSRLV